MNVHKWVWFSVSGDLNSILVDCSLKQVFIGVNEQNVELKLPLKAIKLSGLIFPIALAFEKHRITQEKIMLLKKIFLWKKKWVYNFFLCSAHNQIQIISNHRLFNFETTLMFSEYINNIAKIIKALGMKFVTCFAGVKQDEFNLEFYLPNAFNLLEIITKFGLLRAALEETALNRGLVVKQVKIINPINCVVDNSLFDKLFFIGRAIK